MNALSIDYGDSQSLEAMDVVYEQPSWLDIN